MIQNVNSSLVQLAKEGLWIENPGLVKLLGLCPLLAVSNTLINGLSLGLATLMTLLVSNTLVATFRTSIAPAVRIPLYVLIIAATVSVIELLMQAWLPSLFVTLGIFLPLIVTNCLILGRAEAFAARNTVRVSILDALAMGLGFLAVLVLLGGLRELIGQGSILADGHHLFGETAKAWRVQLFEEHHGMLLAVLPPGAFIGLGLLLAVKNKIDATTSAEIPNSAENQK
ncbi:UNVERIFIED_CONTAM: hypothetical protein GTU68_019115 [Idotea baltica]|nr:hypothetical protein [Idotea baltica]